MTIDSQNLLESILQSLDRVSYIRPEEIPGIDLYMDQVTTFMDSHLSASRRYEDDKILTKTMINNYAKNRLLPPPEKKKYSREHMLLLIFIYYFKSLLSINDIQSLLSPLTERYFHTERPLSLEQVYSEVFSLEKDQIEAMKEDLRQKYSASENTFSEAPEEEQEFLRRKFRVITEILGQIPKTAPVILSQGADLPSIVTDLPGCGRQNITEHPHQCRLPRSVGSEQPIHTLVKLQIDPIHRQLMSVLLCQPVYAQFHNPCSSLSVSFKKRAQANASRHTLPASSAVSVPGAVYSSRVPGTS